MDYSLSAKETSCDIQRESTEKQIERRISEAKKQIYKLERLQELFKKNPDLQETLDLLRGVSIY